LKQIKIAFFTEAGRSRGMGHLVRSYTIYKECLFQGSQATFYLDSDIDFSHKFQDIHTFNWATLKLQKSYDIIFIDSYLADMQIYELLTSYSKLTVFIDDYARLSYPRGIILNFASNAQEFYNITVQEKENYLLGLKYLPIRDQFRGAKRTKKNQLFLMLGGLDINNLSLKIVQALQNIQIKKVVVVNNPETLKSLKRFKNITILHKPSDRTLVKEMAQSRLAISTASMSLYELSCLNVPTIIISVSKDQNIGASALIYAKLASNYVDISKHHWLFDIKKSVLFLLKKETKTYRKIDTNGTKRVVQKIIQREKHER
jgi:spore coat polysaccharide biosynthesis predicted glycosyltransferase SpsG